MQRMWRQMFAAVLGVLAVTGLASAQAPNTLPQPLPPLRAQAVPAQAQLTAAPVIAPVIPVGHTRGSGGCSSCAPSNGPCTGPKSDCAFIFGSCKSFFDPCGPKHGGGWGGGHGRIGGGHGSRCGIAPFGTPYGTGQNMCHYDSFLNH
jgi:hypothetical protein